MSTIEGLGGAVEQCGRVSTRAALQSVNILAQTCGVGMVCPVGPRKGKVASAEERTVWKSWMD